MTIAEAIQEILTKADESFVDTAEERGRQHLYAAMTHMLRQGNYEDTDAFGFIHQREHTFAAVDDGICTLADFEVNDEVLVVKHIYYPPEYEPVAGESPNTFITRASEQQIKKWGIGNLRPRYDKVFYQKGNNFYFYPSDQWDNVKIYAEVVVAPDPDWADTVELTDHMTSAFQNNVIEAAAQLFRQEVFIHEG